MENSSEGEMIRGDAGAALAEVAVAFTDSARLKRFITAISEHPRCDWPPLIGLNRGDFAPLSEECRVSQIHFGNEFCERLLPSRAVLDSALNAVRAARLDFSLVVPPLTDAGLDAVDGLFETLPDGAGIVANDWGLMMRVRRRFPKLELSAGRILCRMLKEPRAPSAQYMELGGHGYMTPGLQALLRRFTVSRVNIDVPPFASVDDLRGADGRVSVHVPFGFTTVGRICRIGCLHQQAADKFATGHNCARECLSYAAAMESPRERHASDLRLFQRGNTIFYCHTPAMGAVVADAIAAGIIDRVIVSGDWNETRRTNYGA
jgi:hypothetical protein